MSEKVELGCKRNGFNGEFNTIHYFIANSLWGLYDNAIKTMQLREVTIVSTKTKINSKTLYYV